MKVILFKHTCEPEFLIKNYQGFKTNDVYYTNDTNVIMYKNIIIENLYKNIHKARVIEDTYFITKTKEIISTDPEDFIISLCFIFNNLKKNGNATTAIEFILPLYDIITYLSICFKTCKIVFNQGCYYLELNGFLPPKNNYFIMFLRYYIDKNKLSPFVINADRDKLGELFKKLK